MYEFTTPPLPFVFKKCMHCKPLIFIIFRPTDYTSVTYCKSFTSESGERFWDLAVCPKTGSIIITHLNNTVHVLDSDLRHVDVFETLGLNTPRGVAIDNNNCIYIADSLNHRIVVSDLKGKCLRCYGQKGSKNGEFNEPYGIAIAENYELYVCDQKNTRIQVITKDGKFLRTFQIAGGLPCFIGVSGRAVAVSDTKGSIYIMDHNGSQITTPKSEEMVSPEYLYTIDEDETVLEGACGLAFDCEGYLVVADRHKFFCIGKLHSSIDWRTNIPYTESDEQWQPSGISLTQSGNILVCDKVSVKLFVIQKYG